MTFNLDTIWARPSRRRARGAVWGSGPAGSSPRRRDDHVPTKLQLLWEAVVTQVTSEVEGNLGQVNPFVVPLAVALFFFILFANWLEMLPTEINHDLHLHAGPDRRHEPHLRDGAAS